jgi:murein endopeptidase
MDEHVSHQNGLDVDVYYPRLDGALRAPVATDRSTSGWRRLSSTASSLRGRR